MATVMIVDDQSTSRLILEELLASLDATLVLESFSSPLAALAWAQANRPDLILTDYKMPEMDGVEFIRRLRAIPGLADVPIIVITVVDDRIVRYQALEAGATDILNKPVDHHECRARCHNLLTMRRQAQMLRNRSRWLEKQVADATRLLRDRERESLLILARHAVYREDPTGQATVRAAHFARLIASRLGLPEEQAEAIELAAMLHDVGMIGVPDRILLKPERLTAEEFDVVRNHCSLGHAFLGEHRSPYLQQAAVVALAHHERWDGSGYPHRLRAESIPLPARIVAVVDAYDALTSPRPWRAAVSMDRAVEILMRAKGAAFDPQCVEAFGAQLDRVARFELDHRPLQDVD
ncbi:MAG: HD domain-containing phosphohydrolase [Gammaproteobacteria bacterium]